MNLLPATQRAETPLGYLIALRHERSAAREGEERPAAILWTDPGEEWTRILGLLRDRLPQLLVLGNDEYDGEARTGPAIWLRCVVDGALEDVLDPAAGIPILYLPVEPLARLAQHTRSPIGGATPDDVADAYRERG